MRFFILILLVLAVVWLWRTKRPGVLTPKKQAPTHPQVLTVVSCAHCMIHLPEGDAVQGRKRLFCSEAHRRASEG